MAYSQQETKEILELYQDFLDKAPLIAEADNVPLEIALADCSRQAVDFIAEEFHRSKRSIQSKLSKEEVYVKVSKPGKFGPKPMTKDQLAEEIVKEMGANPYRMEGLNKAPRNALVDLLEWIKDHKDS